MSTPPDASSKDTLRESNRRGPLANDRAASSSRQALDLHVGNIEQLFNSIDPAPFRERDLDPQAEEFIVGWARELRSDGPLALRVRIDEPTTDGDARAIIQEAVCRFFEQRAVVTRRRLRQLLRVGRASLVIGLLFLAASTAVGDLMEAALRSTRFGGLVRESLLIGGWVAMWRPLEIFLYDWWQIRNEARLFDRLSAMEVEVEAHGAHHVERHKSSLSLSAFTDIP